MAWACHNDRELRVALRVVSWNIDGWRTSTHAQLDLLADTGAELALLQEVTPTSLERLRETGWSGVSALELLPGHHTERDEVRPSTGRACVELSLPGEDFEQRPVEG